MKEIYKDIGTRYQVSNLGIVRSVDSSYIDAKGRQRFRKGLQLKPGKRGDGYLVVNISGFKHKKNWKIHQLVAISFIDNHNNYKCINHKNGIKTDNRVENLEWCTQAQNIKHAYDINLRKPVINKGVDNGYSKQIIDSTGYIYESISFAADLYGIKRRTLNAMLTGQNKNKTDLNYVCRT